MAQLVTCASVVQAAARSSTASESLSIAMAAEPADMSADQAVDGH